MTEQKYLLLLIWSRANVSQSVPMCPIGCIEPRQGREPQPNAECMLGFWAEQFRRSGDAMLLQEAVKRGFGEAEFADELAFCFELRSHN